VTTGLSCLTPKRKRLCRK